MTAPLTGAQRAMVLELARDKQGQRPTLAAALRQAVEINDALRDGDECSCTEGAPHA